MSSTTMVMEGIAKVLALTLVVMSLEIERSWLSLLLLSSVKELFEESECTWCVDDEKDYCRQ